MRHLLHHSTTEWTTINLGAGISSSVLGPESHKLYSVTPRYNDHIFRRLMRDTTDGKTPSNGRSSCKTPQLPGYSIPVHGTVNTEQPGLQGGDENKKKTEMSLLPPGAWGWNIFISNVY